MMNPTRIERMTLRTSGLTYLTFGVLLECALESHALPLRQGSRKWLLLNISVYIEQAQHLIVHYKVKCNRDPRPRLTGTVRL